MNALILLVIWGVIALAIYLGIFLGGERDD